MKGMQDEGHTDSTDDDQNKITWAPNGRLILVVNTYNTFDEKTLWVFDRRGREVVSPLRATRAVWAPDSSRIYLRDYQAESPRWFTLSVAEDTITPLDVPGNHVYAALSPNGRWLATTKAAPNGKVRVLDLQTKKVRRFGEGFLGPIWLSDSEVVVTKVREVPEDYLDYWKSEGTVAISISDGKQRALTLPFTVAEDGGRGDSVDVR